MNQVERMSLRPNDIYLLQKEGFVVEGSYPEVDKVIVSQKGQNKSIEVPVKAYVFQRNVGKKDQETITVFQPQQEM